MAVLVSIPERTLQAGTYDIPAQVVPAGTERLLITVNPVSWPNTPNIICEARMEISEDGGNTWYLAVVMTLTGGPFDPADLATGLNASYGFPEPVGTNVRVRGSWTQFQRERVGASLEAL